MLCLLLLVLHNVNSQSSVDIRSWTLTNSNGSITIRNVLSPIDVYSALYQHSYINWPLHGYNDVAYRWISYDNWTFSSDQFSTWPSNKTSLSVSGLDIYPLIQLNDIVLNATTSQFLPVDITFQPNLLKRHGNIVQLRFISPPLLAKQLSDNYQKTISPNCWPKIFNGECHINLLRKTQSSFGWDWGPAIPTMGIRGRVTLMMTNKIIANIKGVRFSTTSDNDCQQWAAVVSVKLRILHVLLRNIICVKMKIDNLQKSTIQCLQTNDSDIYYVDFSFKVKSSNLKLWWPYEMGTPTAYKLKVSVTHGNIILDTLTDYIGFRQVDLNQSLIADNKGRHFQFMINCRPFIVKGTNWVPRSYLTSDWANASYLEFMLSSVAKANINTIRLWGGGQPEMTLFYLIADRLGIMIWHDLMFAGSLYPDTTDFHDLIRAEISELLWSTQKHPSILLWSGNNEVELLIADGWYNTKAMDPENIASYYRTFSQIIKPLVTRLDPTTPFVLSSPSNGIESEKAHGVSKDPQSVYFGDVHFYLYSGELWDERSYPITRMTTEFGFQSYPSTSTWALITLSEKDFEPNGDLAIHRQHHEDGYRQIESAIIQYFGKTQPRGNNITRDKYSWFSYLSQINQAMILKVHINRLRTSRCNLTTTGEGLTSGAMFWQLNDNWIAPSWSTIESNGQWKIAHYYVLDAFTNERIILAVLDETLTIRLVLPEPITIRKYNLTLSCIDVSNNISTAITGQRNIAIDTTNYPCNVATILSLPVASFLSSCQCKDRRTCLITVTLKNNDKVVSSDATLIVKPKDLQFPIVATNDVIIAEIHRADPDVSVCVITLRSKFVHLFVTLTTTSLGSFSYNGFHLWQDFNVTFSPWYHDQTEFFNCSTLHLQIMSLNTLLI